LAPSGTLKEAVEPEPRSRSLSEPAQLLRSAVNLAAELTRFRDADTGLHLDRVSHYARLIARTLRDPEGLDDEFIDDLSWLALAHDVGKVAIPDHILLKRGALEPAEFEIMKGHVRSGVAVVEELIKGFDFGGSAHVSMLRNIVGAHHEALDGSGYPDGLKAGEIPLEARIVAVADVFDALTSDRPYKETWSQQEAFGFLWEHKGTKFDSGCVVAFESHASEVESIRQRFAEGAAG
jgi:HD-GYP domain-containing protein (c-di-GMP phosphodiesterase class II)